MDKKVAQKSEDVSPFKSDEKEKVQSDIKSEKTPERSHRSEIKSGSEIQSE